MARSLKLFISSSPELTIEREALGQAVAELPVSFGWQIQHTPRAGQDPMNWLDFVEVCEVFLIILGSDYAAPMGLEWEQALRSRRPVFAYCKSVLHSPSAQTLLRQPTVSWIEFDSTTELKSLFSRAIAKFLLERAERFPLQLDDVERLLAEQDKAKEAGVIEQERREGAGDSGIILARGR
jgi:hypothetical protein